ncbi:hypothetical protein EJ065_7026 [Corallococcus coralloides]|uniref:Uncharacterized protein n=1 Tax=Corallococcus coralloides TaxID=184914 RepID=A0A410S3E2_CORCK|nr:hypothetical protein [Corallococcus coralloides]QAT88551.1 hypothetical protein EJ065_7026 [Corallococcus coralloides]
MSPALGLYLRRRDVRGPTKGVIHRHRPTLLQITYGLLHPFRVFYIALLQGP